MQATITETTIQLVEMLITANDFQAAYGVLEAVEDQMHSDDYEALVRRVFAAKDEAGETVVAFAGQIV